ncbi:hypothetical protein ESP57_16230 [Agromyces fucosus]|uniref:Uncharacterized protein n=1 Tax=Agromyces fucosus TaxID=41985 RepID=A0A4V1QRX9_9MICO|nr:MULTISPECIES: hypothetical protein [Agromyces]KQZ07437.1 hypothetical protein ASD23_16375 [Agromyces sp. Root1464]RXZ46453.1 hypothetical protein ESP57_16230 [Agromyces fucosus]
MDGLAGVGDGVSPDEDFTVSQDTEFDEPGDVADDDERSIDDSLDDEVPGVDAERRVDLADDPAAAADE